MKIFLIILSLFILEFILVSFLVRKYDTSKGFLARLFKEPHVSFWRYVLFYGVPFTTIALLVIVFVENLHLTYLKAFVSFAVVWPIAEWMIGYLYQNIFRKRLWTYRYKSIKGYTSWLAVPYWGMDGMLFHYLNSVI